MSGEASTNFANQGSENLYLRTQDLLFLFLELFKKRHRIKSPKTDDLSPSKLISALQKAEQKLEQELEDLQAKNPTSKTKHSDLFERNISTFKEKQSRFSL